MKCKIIRKSHSLKIDTNYVIGVRFFIAFFRGIAKRIYMNENCNKTCTRTMFLGSIKNSHLSLMILTTKIPLDDRIHKTHVSILNIYSYYFFPFIHSLRYFLVVRKRTDVRFSFEFSFLFFLAFKHAVKKRRSNFICMNKRIFIFSIRIMSRTYSLSSFIPFLVNIIDMGLWECAESKIYIKVAFLRSSTMAVHKNCSIFFFFSFSSSSASSGIEFIIIFFIFFWNWVTHTTGTSNKSRHTKKRA